MHSGTVLPCVKSLKLSKPFTVNIKEAIASSAKSSIKFVKKGAKAPQKRTPPVCTVHHASH